MLPPPLLLLLLLPLARAQAGDGAGCSCGASVAGAAVGALLAALVAAAAGLLLWRLYWRGRRGKHLVLVTDSEAAGDQYAFDNPCFRDGTPMAHLAAEKEAAKEDQKARWASAWSPLGALVAGKAAEKRRAFDDSFIGEPHIRVVSLRSHDFTGLGFTVCGNMRDGIFVKDVLHRGPASESGRIAPGDRIDSVRISFRHMVFEDALTILSYASPYDVQLEVENATTSRPSTLIRTKRMSGSSVGPADRICHPFYRSQSIADLAQIGKDSLKRGHNMGGTTTRSPKISKSDSFNDSGVGDYPTLKVTNSPKSSLPRKDVTKPDKATRLSPTTGIVVKPERIKKVVGKTTVIPNKSSIDEPDGSLETVNKYQKFGVRVLPESSDSLKNVSVSVQGNTDVSKEQQNIKQGSVPDIVYTTAVEPERHQNEKNIMLEKVVTLSGNTEEDSNAGSNSSSSRAKNYETGTVKSSITNDSGQTPNSIFYDERAIDVGPVTEHRESAASMKQDAKKESEKFYSKNTDSDTSPEGTKEHNVKLFLSKGLQNLKEKLHPDRRKSNSSDIPSLSGHEVKNKTSNTQAACFSSDSEETDDDKIFSMEGGSKKTEKKLGKENSVEVKDYNFEVPTDIPEEVQRAAMAARSNRKTPAVAATAANVSLNDLNRRGDGKANESRKSLSEDSSSDYEAMSGIASDSLGRPPKRHNKRKAPLPPAEDCEGSNNKIKESADPASRHKITGMESTFNSEENEIRGIISGSEVPDRSIVGSTTTHLKRSIVQDLGGCEDKSPDNFTLVTNIPSGTAQKKDHDISGKDITNITVNINATETAQSFVPKTNVHGDMGNINIHNGLIPADSSSSGTSTMETRNLDYDSVNISNTNSDSDSDLERIEADCGYEGKKNKKGGTTIELNSSHITIHHSPSNTAQVCTEIENESTRKAASLGDLSRLDTEQPMSILERAVSLDLAEGGTPMGTKKRKAPLPPGEDYLGATQDGEEGVSYKKEPRLDGGMDTFQRQRLKKSSDWGTLEEALKQTENFLGKSNQLKDGKEFLEISKVNTFDELSDASSKLMPSNLFSVPDSQQVLQEGISKTRTSSHSSPDAVSQEFNIAPTGTVNLENTVPVKASDACVNEPNEIKDQHQKMVLHVESDLQEGTNDIPGSQMENNSTLSDQQISSGISYSLQSESNDTPARPMRLASSKKVSNTDSTLKLDSYKQIPSGVLSSTPLTKRVTPNKDQENSFMDVMNSSPISRDKITSLQTTAVDNQPSAHNESSVEAPVVTDSRIHNISSDIASKSHTVSTTDPFMTATSSVQASIGGTMSQDDLMWSKETQPPDLPTTPVPVLSQVSSFVPSSSSMTYITEIQVVTSDDGTKPKHTLSDISQSTGMSVPTSLHLEKVSPKTIYQDSLKLPKSSATLEMNEPDIDTSDVYQQSRNNVTITAIKAVTPSDNASQEVRQSMLIAPNNNANTVADRKGKLPRPPVPPRKSEILSLMSSNSVSQAHMHQNLQPSTSTVERPHTVTQSAQGDSNGRFITFSTLTPRGGLGNDANVGRHNSSFEQWVFLDEGKMETPTNHNGLERAIGNVNQSPIMKHSSFLTFPNNGTSRSQSVTHISFDTNKESTDTSNQ